LIPGSDVSGTVAALGAGVGGFALGDAVYGATNDQFVGGYAEYALVEAGKVRAQARGARLCHGGVPRQEPMVRRLFAGGGSLERTRL
jgi:NADPH:quinone reductase-like Zn-dependent oxidoreductase